MPDVRIGHVVHYYDKIGVAVIKLVGDIAQGDNVKFTRGGEELFVQKITSMQVDHTSVEKADAGAEIALKTDKEVKDGAQAFKVI